MDSSTTSDPSRASGITSKSYFVALLAAGVGALAWGAVAFFTGYEVGYLAWGIGVLVGVAMTKFGGRGTTAAIVAAVLSVAGIAGGKLLGTRFVVEQGLREGCQATFTPELHAELVNDAGDLALLGADAGDEQFKQFMFEHHYTGADSAEGVQEEELREFLASTVPDLQALRANRPSYEQWYAEREAESRQSFEEDFSIIQANIDELNAIDVLFLVLGVSTAFGIVRRSSAPGVQPPSQSASSAGQQDVRKAA